MRQIFVLFTVCTLSLNFISCAIQKPISKEAPQNNETYKVEYLFEHDGCKVYRFRDAGNYVYFTNCTGEVTAIGSDSTAMRVHTKVRGK